MASTTALSLLTGQSHRIGSSRSMATVSAAPRRSISNAQNPSNVATSRQRFPSSDAGKGSCASALRVSTQPGVTTPGASSSVWYHWRSSAPSRSCVAASTARPYQLRTVSRGTRARRRELLYACAPPLVRRTILSSETRIPAEGFRFDREQLIPLAEERRAAYAAAHPFPHIVIDDFLPEDVLDAVLEEFPSPDRPDWFKFDSPLERKLATKDDTAMGRATRHLLAELNGSVFIDFLERLTSIDGLVPDPHLVGGGLHQIKPGGHLKVHADFNRHPRTNLERRLNALIYLNRDWQDSYGGALELWSRDMSTREAQILPLFNRLVVFSTTSTSYHGHPEPLTCPEDRTRKSMALYYYSRDRPAHELNAAHNTLFQARPGEELPTADAPAPRRGRKQRLKAVAKQIPPPIVVEAVRRRRRR